MLKKKMLWLFILTFYVSFGQTKNFLENEIISAGDSIKFIQIKTDTLFNSQQIISFLIFPQKAFEKYKIEFAYSQRDLEKTSTFGMSNNAIAAVNGSFFNVDSGGSVTYLEINDSVISKTIPSLLKWAKPDSLIDGVVIITKDMRISLQPVKSDSFYEHSKQEAAVMVSGPLLLLDSRKVKLPRMDFVFKRHPRTFLCTYKGSIIFITVDGRSEEGEGMTLIEAQKFLQGLMCDNAINLDGGGSTTMWIKDKGVVNFPSDKTGERPVANAILILRK
jgi:exopolysaccharide biosynthesis protein